MGQNNNYFEEMEELEALSNMFGLENPVDTYGKGMLDNEEY